jgi:hypothetical protein
MVGSAGFVSLGRMEKDVTESLFVRGGCIGVRQGFCEDDY